jgi:nitrogen fixation protein NifX
MRRLQLVDAEEVQKAGEIPGGLKIAFATQDMRRVDAHFGSARAIMIYEVGPDDHRLIEALEFDDVSDQTGSGGDRNDVEKEDRIETKVQAIKGCAMLFVVAIGGGAAARVVGCNIYPVKVREPEAISDTIARIQTMLRGSPPPWLRKLMLRGGNTDLDFVDD